VGSLQYLIPVHFLESVSAKVEHIAKYFCPEVILTPKNWPEIGLQMAHERKARALVHEEVSPQPVLGVHEGILVKETEVLQQEALLYHGHLWFCAGRGWGARPALTGLAQVFTCP